MHDPGGGEEGEEGAAEERDGDGQPGGAEESEVGDDADAGGDEEQAEPAEEAVGGLLEGGRGVAAAKDVPGGEQDHAEDRAGDLEVGGRAKGFACQLEEQQEEDGLDHRHRLIGLQVEATREGRRDTGAVERIRSWNVHGVFMEQG